MAQKIISFVLWLATILAVIVTILPLTTSYQWWIRMWDFPRVHILICALIIAILALWLMHGNATLMVLALMGVIAYQGTKIYPFTPLAQTEIDLSEPGERAQISFIASNVLMENQEHQRAIDMINTEKPDVLLLMETDDVWAEALKETLKHYSTVVSHPRDNHYGMIFATNLEVAKAEMVFLSEDETPTLLSELKSPEGLGFHFVGMHPRPPVPGQDTKERDEQTERAALLTQASDLPVIAMGDFNDVAWSHTAHRFKRIGDYFDPRVGRGFISSFDAKHPVLRFPIDQLYVTKGIDLISFGRKEKIGSDHFPMGAVITITGQR